ncbi:hypothetical protein [Allopusillimonas ginsengisoli]|uniref:hypothetical protein n=1 Tax=Allopusillimonas ginsengisoli TaxID=453575 RepID=UPI0010227FDC|nr:hypothetical protein [Allopusillimonas ginsengisoli]TEA79839.1 hypothetical protein ERE07_02550 [Allopusillimonas ginsengisoli]
MYTVMALIGSFFSLWALLAWLACGLFAGHLAGEKNRCGFCWFCWGILFGPLALITAVGLPDNRTMAAPATRTQSALNAAYQPLPVELLDPDTSASEEVGRNVSKMSKDPLYWILVLAGIAALAFIYLKHLR